MRAAQARLSIYMSKCHIVGNHMSRLISVFKSVPFSDNLKVRSIPLAFGWM